MFTIDAAGGSTRFLKLRVDGFAFQPNWAPDGRRVIFGLFGPDQEDLYTADSDGSDVVRVTDTSDLEDGPDWR